MGKYYAHFLKLIERFTYNPQFSFKGKCSGNIGFQILQRVYARKVEIKNPLNRKQNIKQIFLRTFCHAQRLIP